MGRPRKHGSDKARRMTGPGPLKDTRPQGECSWCGLYRRLTGGYCSGDCMAQAMEYVEYSNSGDYGEVVV